MAVTIVLGTWACGSEDAESRSQDDRAAIRNLLESYYRDFSTGNWTAFADHFWTDGYITTMWQPPTEDADRVVTTTVETFVAEAPRSLAAGRVLHEELLGSQIRVSGDLAQAWVRHETRMGDGETAVQWWGVDAFTLLRHGGTWKIVSLVFAPQDSTGRD